MENKSTLNIVIPMAGIGSRFKMAGYLKPKPFIDVKGFPMIENVINNLNFPNAKFYLIGRKEHLNEEKGAIARIKEKYNSEFIEIDSLTEGTACTVLFAKDFINNDTPLLIANSDQIIDVDIANFINDNKIRNLDGNIMCFTDNEMNPKWSFAKSDKEGFVIEVKEKVAISKNATVGIYLFSKGKDFVNYCIDMIIRNDRVNNEFYTCPVYNYAIKEGKKIGIFLISHSQMHGIGTPEDLKKFIDL